MTIGIKVGEALVKGGYLLVSGPLFNRAVLTTKNTLCSVNEE
jgi:hypothetical protein